MAAVAVEHLTKHYGGAGDAAVKNVSFTASDGEFLVLLGPSGCGKSSVLRMIAGLEPITSGTVSIDNRLMNEVPARDRDIAMVFQSYALYPHMNVYDNLAFGLRRRGVAKGEIERRVLGSAAKLGLDPFLNRKPHALSGGQRQRVALGRAIVREPKVFLFDEPLSNLDAALRVSTRNEIIRQQQELGVTTIYVTHDQVEAMTMGHRICILNKGEVVQIGKPLDVYRRPVNTFVARFLGNPPMNLLTAALEPTSDGAVVQIGNGRFALAGIRFAALASAAMRQILIGIRPEDLYETARDDDLPQLQARVVAVEPLGAETLVVFTIGGSTQEATARVGRETGLRVGDHTRVYLDTTAIRPFDAETGLAIACDEL